MNLQLLVYEVDEVYLQLQMLANLDIEFVFWKDS